MKVKVLATVIAVTFVMGALGTADAGLFNNCHNRKSSCCKTSCATKCQTVSTCAPTCAPRCARVRTCCSPRPRCCATAPGCAPAASGGAPSSEDVESIPAPPQKDTEPPKPGTPDTET